MYCKILKAWTECNADCLRENCINAEYTKEIFDDEEDDDKE